MNISNAQNAQKRHYGGNDMSNRLFQGIIHQMHDTIDRVIGVIDSAGLVIACSELSKIGETRSQVKEEMAFTTDMTVLDGFTYQHIGNRHEMIRNSVPISDTDSVITTMVKWMLWYNKGDMFVNQDSYNIAAMGIYFMTKCVEHSLYKYSIGYGAKGKFAKIMKMKNEFLYVALVLYSLKKTYAGIIAIHEGIKLKKYKVDIKGANLRSSAICKESTDFNKELIVKVAKEIGISQAQVSRLEKNALEEIKLNIS